MIEFNSDQLDKLIQLVKLAGADILQIYQHPEVTNLALKADTSPLTAADVAAHKRLSQGLGKILDLPVLSEESNPDDYQNRHQWQSFWLIDPLDGTKEFLARNGQFTVNVALILQGVAVLGAVYQPVTEKCYWGINDHSEFHLQQLSAGAWRQIAQQVTEAIYCESIQDRHQQALALRALVSQHHHSRESQQKLEQIQQHWPAKIDIVPLGSSLKICAIAEGEADLYLRIGPTSEWDTAAAQAVLEAAGGELVALKSPYLSFRYNQRNTLLNSDFCAASHTDFIIDCLNKGDN